MNSEEMTPEEKQAKIDKYKFILNHPKFKGDKKMLQSEINKLEWSLRYNNETVEDREKRKIETRRIARERQRKRYDEKYTNYELSWGGRYSNYECLLRIDPFLFD